VNDGLLMTWNAASSPSGQVNRPVDRRANQAFASRPPRVLSFDACDYPGGHIVHANVSGGFDLALAFVAFPLPSSLMMASISASTFLLWNSITASRLTDV
jgi:hypothetical protein